MTLTEFKQQLAETGVTLKQVETAFVKQKLSLHKVIERWRGLYHVIGEMNWNITDEGHRFWADVACGRPPAVAILAKEGVILRDYEIERCANGDWRAGCHRLDRKRRMKLFKLLAKDLGYEVE